MTGKESEERRRLLPLELDKKTAQEMYDKVEGKDDDEVVRPTFEMKAGDLKDELFRTWGPARFEDSE